LLLAAFLTAPVAAQADWKPAEKEAPYAITGTTGPELYASIGERGPKAGIGRAIAFTDFKLTWTRDYRPQADGACTLASARPKLVLTYALPRPAGKLAEPVATNWKTFIDGVRRHERMHGEMIVAMVKEIEAFSVGLSAPDDPNCKKIRARLQERLAQISQAQRQKSRDFDRVELSDGGNVHQLILTVFKGGLFSFLSYSIATGRRAAPLQPADPFDEQLEELLMIDVAQIGDVLVAPGDAPPVGDRHAHRQLRGRLDRDIDGAAGEEFRLQEIGDDAWIVQRPAVGAVFGFVEALEEFEHLGDRRAGLGAEPAEGRDAPG
jgi:predicted secreted Zn-dependent protease